jgi:hypothetical protein
MKKLMTTILAVATVLGASFALANDNDIYTEGYRLMGEPAKSEGQKIEWPMAI